jgi:3-phosphoshikimate 1-carboxyvinyltransferase
MFAVEFLDIPPLTGASGVLRLPGSKSISNRALLLAALSEGTTTLLDLLESDDTSVMLNALRQLGCKIESQGKVVNVVGLGGRLAVDRASLFLGNAGTAMRPLVAALAMLGGDFELSGVDRMHERPIGDLVDALRQLGCHIEYTANEGFPPLRLAGSANSKLTLDAPILIRGDVSSQFLTALLMALPLVAEQDIHIDVVGELISKPYIEITVNLMRRFGVVVKQDGWRRFTIAGGSKYRSPGILHIEADASSASYFIALGAINPGARGNKYIDIQGVGSDSIQGDIRFVEAARLMGARVDSASNSLRVSRGEAGAGWPLKAIDLDCNHIPDAAMTLAVMALYAEGTTTLRNIASWRVKETDRIAAVACELRKLGATVQEGADFIAVTPPATAADWTTAPIHTYDDHRIAMCFSLAAFNPAGLPIRILDPKCVAKTYPDYFEDLFELVQANTQDIPVICIDGPTASGKGTLASQVAQKLGYHYLDSGALYRLTAVAALRAGVDLNDGAGIAQIARALEVRFDGEEVFLGAENVSAHIRTEEAGTAASKVSIYPEVRIALLAIQQGFRKLPGLVADGRDMASVVFKDAQLKIYLTADAESRAERRHKQLISKGNSSTIIEILQGLQARDNRDTSRLAAPLKHAEDAKLLDNSSVSIEKSVSQVLDWWQSTRPF